LEYVCTNNNIDDTTIKDYLEALGLKPEKNNISVCLDSEGYAYKIPVYCIQDPYEYKITKPSKTEGTPSKIKTISVYLRQGKEQVIVLCKNTWTIIELKKSITNIGKTRITQPDKIRLFFGGMELHNNHELWAYNIDDDFIIQLLYNN
jgi:hypothetical protein